MRSDGVTRQAILVATILLLMVPREGSAQVDITAPVSLALAGVVPAHRAASVDPLIALRTT